MKNYRHVYEKSKQLFQSTPAEMSNYCRRFFSVIKPKYSIEIPERTIENVYRNCMSNLVTSILRGELNELCRYRNTLLIKIVHLKRYMFLVPFFRFTASTHTQRCAVHAFGLFNENTYE